MSDSLIFISYASEDEIFIKKFLTAFASHNYNYWYFRNRRCSNYNEEIAEHIDKCDCLIAFMSRYYDKSDYCHKELALAAEYNKEIFFVSIDNIVKEQLSGGNRYMTAGYMFVYRNEYKSEDDFIEGICNDPILVKYRREKNIIEENCSVENQEESVEISREDKCSNNVNNFDTPIMRGKDVLYDDKEYSFVYYGEVFDGWRHGHGKCVWENGDIYEGDWLTGKRSGKGKMTYANGDMYEGDWKDDKVDGVGKYKWAYGDVYEGDWMNNNRHGKGVMIYKYGGIYNGEWKFGKRYGFGKMTYSDNTEYEGEWKNDVRHGFGRVKRINGTYKSCQYINGEEQYASNTGWY